MNPNTVAWPAEGIIISEPVLAVSHDRSRTVSTWTFSRVSPADTVPEKEPDGRGSYDPATLSHRNEVLLQAAVMLWMANDTAPPLSGRR